MGACLSQGFTTCPSPCMFSSLYSMLLSWRSQLLRDLSNRYAISGSLKSPFGARVLVVGFNSSRPIQLIVAHLHIDRNWVQQMSSVCCLGSSTSLMCSSCNCCSSPSIIRPQGVTLITVNQLIHDSLIRGYGRNLAWSACEANMKGSNLLYLRLLLASTTPNLFNRTPLLTTGSNHFFLFIFVVKIVFSCSVHFFFHYCLISP